MGLFGKRKERAAEAAALPPGGGIRDLSEARPPDVSEGLGSDLGPPAPGASGRSAAPPMPPMPPSALAEEDSSAQGEAGAAPPPAQSMSTGGMPAPPLLTSAPLPPATSFEPSQGSGDLSMAAPAPAVQAAGGLERLDNVEQRLSDMSRRVDLLDKASDDIRNDISRIRDSIAQIEGDMRELTSLYDLISTQINPFIDTSTMEEKPAMEVEHGAIPDLDALFEPTPELSGERAPEQAAVTETVPSAPEGAALSAEGGEAKPSLKTPRLVKIGADASCHLALMEWIRFLLERVNRAEIPSVLSFYQRIGWISGEIKADMLEIIRGIGAVAGEPAAPSALAQGGPSAASAKDASGDIVIAYGKEQARELKGPAKGQAAPKGAPSGKGELAASWRLTPDDHIGSLMYIEWIRSGGDLDRDKLEEIRREVSRLRSGLDGFFSL
jgi:archaellum component FlaD/FlaE